MLRKSMLWISRLTLTLLAGGALALLLPRLITTLQAMPRTYTAAEAPSRPVAIVFGAGLRRDGTPSPVLRDRIARGVELYFAGKVDKLLMSGDNASQYYDEPGAMREYAIGLGVPAEDIVVDYAGLRTYDTCYRARHIFDIEQAILVTQAFHLPRAMFTCSALGVEAIGVAADRLEYVSFSRMIWNVRETFATFVAFLDVTIRRPDPVLGIPTPIFPPEV